MADRIQPRVPIQSPTWQPLTPCTTRPASPAADLGERGREPPKLSHRTLRTGTSRRQLGPSSALLNEPLEIGTRVLPRLVHVAVLPLPADLVLVEQ